MSCQEKGEALEEMDTDITSGVACAVGLGAVIAAVLLANDRNMY